MFTNEDREGMARIFTPDAIEAIKKAESERLARFAKGEGYSIKDSPDFEAWNADRAEWERNRPEREARQAVEVHINEAVWAEFEEGLGRLLLLGGPAEGNTSSE